MQTKLDVISLFQKLDITSDFPRKVNKHASNTNSKDLKIQIFTYNKHAKPHTTASNSQNNQNNTS